MKEKGSILILGLLMMAILLMIGGVFLSLTGTNYSMLISDSDVLKAYWISQAGIKKAIYNLKDDFSKHIHTLNKYQFSKGEYELSISSLDTTGIRNILCMSIGTYKNSSYAMATEVQLDTPTDYLYFFDGNGEFGSRDAVAPVVLGGPIHSNAHIRFTPWYNYIYVIKPVNIKGPTISTAGLVTRSEAYNPGTDGLRKVTAGAKYKATEYADLPLQSESEWENTISEYYKDYIDERWYIRGRKYEDSYGNKYYTISNSSGLSIKEFVNDSLRRKKEMEIQKHLSIILQQLQMF